MAPDTGIAVPDRCMVTPDRGMVVPDMGMVVPDTLRGVQDRGPPAQDIRKRSASGGRRRAAFGIDGPFDAGRTSRAPWP